MRILGADLGTLTGWGCGLGSGDYRFGSFHLSGLDDANRPKSLSAVYSTLQSLVRNHNADGVVIEAPLSGGVTKVNKRGIRTGTSAHGIQVLTMLSGAAQAGAYSGGARHFWFPYPNVWRKAVLGNGYPEKPKEAALRYCRLVLKLDLQDHNIAEALCLAQYGHGQAKLF